MQLLKALLLACVMLAGGVTTALAQGQGSRVFYAGPNEAPPQGERMRDLPVPILIRRTMNPGDIVARGTRVPWRSGISLPPDAEPQGDCQFNFGVRIDLFQGTRSVRIERGPDCTAVIAAIENSNDVIELNDLRARREALDGKQTPLAKLIRAFFPPLYAQWPKYQQSVYGEKRSYGGGTPWLDGLTAEQGFFKFFWSAGQATQITGWGNTYGWACTAGRDVFGASYCQPPLGIPPMFPTNLGWWAYNIFIGTQEYGPSATVHRIDYASFFFSQSQLFIHTIFSQRIGYGNGGGTCTLWYTGSVPIGTYNTCTVSPPQPY